MHKVYNIFAGFFLLISTLGIAQPVIGINTFFTNTTTAIQANTACSITKSAILDGWLFSISSTSNCGLNQTNTTGGDGRLQYLVGFGTLTQATFGSSDGSEFALTNIVWGVSTSSWTSKPMTFVGYKNGIPVPGATLNATTPSGTGMTNTLTVTFTSNIAFNDVDDIRLAANSTTCNSILFLETIVISTPTPACSGPTLTVSGNSNVLCYGQSNGSATMSAAGGSGFTYTWSPSGGNTASATGLPAGIYTLSANNNSCTIISTKTVQITQPTAIASATGVTYALCNGGLGSASVSASGGTGALTYSWSTGATGTVISTVAGLYTVAVKDANNCVSTGTTIILQPSALVSSTAVTNIACNGGTGSATITASGGTAPRTFSWSTGSTNSFVTSALAGAYTVSVTDANSCTLTKTIIVTQPSALVTTTAVTNVSCNSGSNGSATITASGGTGAYTYSWSTGATTSVISTALAGAYTATVTDANSCTSVKSSVITQPSALNTATAVTNVVCSGGTGSATITASGGTGSRTYSWSTGATTSVVASVLAGIYTATVTDANGCTSIKSSIITEPTALVSGTAITNAVCNGGTGSATLTATGGTGAYTYSWSNAATTSVVASLTAGIYTGTVTDANNCQSIKTISITVPTSITITVAAGSPSICSGNGSTLTANASGGTGAVTYTWVSGPANATFVVTPTISTIYTVAVTDVNACSGSQTVNIAVGYGPTITVNNGTICAGQSFSISASGAASYTYSGGNALVSPLSNSSYTITGTGANGCVNLTGSVSQVTVNTLPVISISNYTICSGASVTLNPGGANSYTYNGGSAVVTPTATTSYSITGTSLAGCISAGAAVSTIYVNSLPTISVNNGTICAGRSFTINPSGAFSYSYTGGSNVVSPALTSTYGVTGTGTNGCVSAAPAISTLTVFALPTLTLNNGSICPGNSFTLNPSGASTYTYLNGGPAVNPIITTTYSVTGTSSLGCPASNTVSAVVTVTNTLLISIAGTKTICDGESTLLTANGASTYSWNTNVITSTISLSPSINTSYTVFGLSGTCSNSAVVNVTVNTTPTISISGTNTLCAGTSITLTASGANTYIWSNSSTGASVAISPTASISYSVTGTNSNNCSASAAGSATVYALPMITANDGMICAGSSFTLSPVGATTYTYSSGTALVSPTLNSSYTITGTSAEGCAASNTAVVSVTVNALPVVSASVTQATICFGENTILSGNGATTYTWTGGATNGIPFSPSVTAMYSVSGTDPVTGCSSTNIATQLVTVNPLPVLSVISTNSLLCVGETATLTVSGATTFTWNGGLSNSTITVAPISDATFSVIGIDANACTNTATFVQFVSDCTGLGSLNASTASFFGVYPNPNTGSFTVELRAASMLLITNVLGTVVFHETMAPGKHSFDIQNQAKGIYLVQVIEQGVSQSMKVITQ